MGEELKPIELPIAWCLVKHKEIAHINPKIPFSNITEDLQVSFLPMSAVEAVTGKYDLSIIKTFKEVKKGYTPFINGDLVFAKITPCMENGKIAIVNNLANGLGFGSTEFHVSRFSALVNKYYFFYFFNQSIFKKEAKKYMTGSAGQLRVPKTYFENINIPFPPLAEQHRIVAKIEELFSELDKGIESLKKAQEQLKIYRQAVLKYAFEGKLTEKWREQQIREGKLESAESLLEKIKLERERLYQEQLKEWEQSIQQWEANGKQGKKPVKPNKPIQIKLSSELSDLIINYDFFHTIPDSWKLVSLINLLLFEPRNGYSPKPVKYETTTKSLTLTATTSGKFNAKHFKYLDEQIEDNSHLWIKNGDILIQRGNTREYVGISAIYTGISKQFIYPDLMMKIVCSSEVTPHFIHYAINMKPSRRYFQKKATGTAGSMPKINKEIVNNLLIPIPSKKEQIQIVQEIESRISICDQVEATITENLQRAESLRQSILKQAFEGKLVPQDLNDEPAEKLLERIKQEKSKVNQSLQQELNLKEI